MLVVVVVVVVGILPSRETMVCALCDFGLISLVESSDGCDSAARSLHDSLYRSCRTRSLTVGLVLGSAASFLLALLSLNCFLLVVVRTEKLVERVLTFQLCMYVCLCVCSGFSLYLFRYMLAL